jgi:hypothetical protein
MDIGAQGLSRLPGNWHGRFLGGGGLVTVRCYPTSSGVGNYEGIAFQHLKLQSGGGSFQIVAQSLEN